MSEPAKYDYHVGEDTHAARDDASAEAVGVVKQQETYAFDESRKIGVTGAVFLILNKMIGTGSKSDDLAGVDTRPTRLQHALC